jgi:membrane protein
MPSINTWKNRILSRFERLKNRLLGFGLIKFLWRVMQEMSQDDGTNMAAGIAYYAFLSIFPLLLGIIGLLGLFLPSQAVQDQIFSFVQDNIPGAVEVIENNIRNVIQLRGALGIIGILGLLWTGSGLLSAAGHSINRAWDIPRELPFYIKKARDVGLTIGLSILFFLSLGAGAILSFIPVGEIPVVGNYFIQIFLRFVSFSLAFVIFLILFKIMPNTRTYWRHIWPGALFTALLFEIGRVAILYYINNFANFQAVYGVIGSVIALLVWIYYSAIIIILGAEFTAEYSRLRRGIARGGHSHSTAKP